ncbi:MAG: family 16 glycoside hydrolase [Planctomycetota bacterium]
MPHEPHVTALVDGGGEVNNPWKWVELPGAERRKLIEEARHNERRMRFNICFTLMGDGYAAFDYHTTSRGHLWWYPEWDAKLGAPRGPMRKCEGYWLREFEGATVCVNPFPQPATVKECGGAALPAFDGLIALREGESTTAGGWRSLPLVTDGKVDPAWLQLGWGGFAVDGQSLRTDCDGRGMGLLFYRPEKFGDCQIRVVYRSEKPKSNAGVFVRIDEGVLDKAGEKSPEVHRDAKGKLSPEMIDRLKEASDKGLGGWYPVHHGYEVQIMDGGDEWHRTGAIYSLAKAAAVPEKPQTEWRTMIITLDGERIVVDVDGKRLSSFDAASPNNPPRKDWTEPVREVQRPTRGYIGLQNHDPGDVVRFKEVSVRPITTTD